MTTATQSRIHKRARDIALGAAAILAPLGVGLAVSRLTRSRRGGMLAGEPSFAGFDPPSTLPLLRRNEIWLPLG